MPVDYYDSEDSEFSETDISVHGGSVHGGRRSGSSFHRRSSHHRRPERREYKEFKETVLSPVLSSRHIRSASTGGRRPHRHSPEAQVPAVMIVNEQATRSSNANSNKPRRVQNKTKIYENESDEALAGHSGRHRAGTTVSVSREHSRSPFHRDYELMMNQRMLDRNDVRQDLDIWKQQQEIERLERELERHREKVEAPREVLRDVRETRRLREEEEWYEDEISERLHRLERYEKQSREEEEAKKAEHRWRLKKFEEAEKEAAEKEELKAKMKQQRLAEIAKQQADDAERDRIKKEIQEEEMRQAREAEEARAKEAAMKAAAVEEWKREQERIAKAQKEEAERRDKEFRDRLRVEFGYNEEEIEAILNKKKKDEADKAAKEKQEAEDKEKAEKEKEKAEKEKKEKEEEEEKKKKEELKIIEERKTTWIKVHRKHLLPETLLAYGLPWEWDERDSNYIIIKRWIDDDFQETLFAHTRRLRDNKVIAQTSHSTTELRINDRGKDRMYLVRKKSPGRKFRIFA
ncbi:hypothetical protein N7495_003831 [Penicillium taxi]|uniref:uncharacterized protein n=1 Tax=Penicillium taxi TaxID=168475 RepID=UPI0025454F49|nr:uncharacterized protein N7495_003831 [Penicillium taxi]KAJ5899087.1 hypothetical protein N7495_003831 [Penicillium taxi]